MLLIVGSNHNEEPPGSLPLSLEGIQDSLKENYHVCRQNQAELYLKQKREPTSLLPGGISATIWRRRKLDTLSTLRSESEIQVVREVLS